MQPDNNLQEPYNTQNYNRYGYVLNNPLKYTDPTGKFTWSDFVAGVAIVVGVGLLIASAGVLSPWSAGLIGSGVAHFGATASNYFSAGSETRGNWDASSTKAGINFSITKDTDLGGGSGKDKPNNNNPVEVHNYVSLNNTMITGNEPPVSFFMRGDDYLGFKVYTNVFDENNKKGNYNDNDSIFEVYGHGAVGFFADGKLNKEMTNGMMFDDRMSKVSLSYRKLINSGTDPKVINLYLCESAKGGIKSMAYKISKQHPNTTVVGYSDYVYYGRTKNGTPSIVGVSTNIKTNLNDGYRIVFQNGVIISQMLYSTFQLFNK